MYMLPEPETEDQAQYEKSAFLEIHVERKG